MCLQGNVLNRLIKQLFLFVPMLMVLQSCSYIDTMKRANYNEQIKGTPEYYDNKCLVAEECATVSAKVILPANSNLDSLAIAVVVVDGNESRVIDLEIIHFIEKSDTKVSYFFFDLPVGTYTAYALSIPDQNISNVDKGFEVVAKGSGSITQNDLKMYQNAIVLDDVIIDSDISIEKFPYTLGNFSKTLYDQEQHQNLFLDKIDLDHPLFSHQVAMEGLYYPESFKQKTKPLYRMTPTFKKGTIPILFVHGMGGTPRDWKYMLENLDLTLYTPYVLYYPSGEDFTKLARQYNAWISSDKIFESGPGVIVAHSFGGIIVRDGLNLEHESNKILFISLATPYGGDAKASDGVKDAPYVIPSWRSIADDGTFIKNLYRTKLSDDETFELIFAYDNSGDGLSGDGRVPLEKQLRSETQKEARSIRGFNEDHISILQSTETVEYINTLLESFAQENIKK